MATNPSELQPSAESSGAPSWLFPSAFGALAIAVAFGAGLYYGPGANTAVGGILSVQSDTTTLTDNLRSLLPFGFAFGAGMLAAVNPCGFVMLPAYLTLYVSDAEAEDSDSRPSAFMRAMTPVLELPVVQSVAAGVAAVFSTRVGSAIYRAVRWAVRALGVGLTMALGFLIFSISVLIAVLTLGRVRPSAGVEDLGGEAIKRILRGVGVSLTMGLGFVALFGLAGLVVSVSQEAVRVALPWIGFVMGFILAVLGAYILAGGKLYTGLAQRMAGRVGDPRESSMRSYFLFGISYALASLSCTLPLFLNVVANSFSRSGIANGVLQFVAYAGGMTFLILIITITIAVAKSAVVNGLRRALPYLNTATAAVLVVIGAYLIFYWMTEGDIATSFGVN